MALTVLLLWERWSPFLLRGCPSLLPESLWVTARPFLRSLSAMGSKERAAVRVVSRVLLVALVLIIPATLVLIIPATLPALAYATPPDPSWIDGIYDDADHDDVVVLVTSGTGTVGPAILADLQPIPPLVSDPPPSTEKAILTLSAAAVRPRAPPVS